MCRYFLMLKPLHKLKKIIDHRDFKSYISLTLLIYV
jgi:hypothetical protein